MNYLRQILNELLNLKNILELMIILLHLQLLVLNMKKTYVEEIKVYIYTFQVQGQVCHYINELLPSNSHPSYLQLYFYDSKHEIENRFYVSNKMNSCILEKIIVILKVNPYSNFFQALKNVPNLENYKIHIRSNVGLDQRIYNSPSINMD